MSENVFQADSNAPAVRPPALTIEERDRILQAVERYASTVRDLGYLTDDNSDTEHGDANDAIEYAKEWVERLLNGLTTTTVNQELLNRTLERDRLIEELQRSKVAAQNIEGDLRRAMYIAEDRLTQFQAKVLDVVSRYAEEHDWVDVDAALTELGLARPRVRYIARVQITVTVEATLRPGNVDVPVPGWVRDSIGVDHITDAVKDSFEFDDEHEAGEVTDVDLTVLSVRGLS